MLRHLGLAATRGRIGLGRSTHGAVMVRVLFFTSGLFISLPFYFFLGLGVAGKCEPGLGSLEGSRNDGNGYVAGRMVRDAWDTEHRIPPHFEPCWRTSVRTVRMVLLTTCPGPLCPGGDRLTMFLRKPQGHPRSTGICSVVVGR